MTRPLRVFLCHSSNDKPAVRELYQKLYAEPWIQPWLDEEELYPGQDWNMEIEKAIEATDVIIVCLSNNSITKDGYVQREIRIALDYADYKPEGTLFIIPVRLEECTPPKRLARWQYADYFEGQRERTLNRLLISLQRRSMSFTLDKFSKVMTRLDNLVTHSKELKYRVQTLNLSLASLSGNSEKFVLSNGMEFMRVPAGEYVMGEDQGDGDIEGMPPYVLNVPYDFWMARYPVTNELFNMYIAMQGVEHPVPNWKTRNDHPVVNVNWRTAMNYCKWLDNVYRNELPLNLALRLPTETEWEKAARGIDGREYPWGNKYDKNKCNTEESGIGYTVPVHLFSPNGDSPYGCADMAGNVFEWTHSVAMDYPYECYSDREDENSKYVRIIRGGSFFENNLVARCACRSLGNLEDSYDGLGFRVVASLPASYLSSIDFYS